MVENKDNTGNKKNNDTLEGMNEICRYVGKSESTVLQKHREERLPISPPYNKPILIQALFPFVVTL